MNRTLTALTCSAGAFVLTALVLAMAPSGQAAPAGLATPAASPRIVNGDPAGANANPYMVTMHTTVDLPPGAPTPPPVPIDDTTLTVQAARAAIVGAGAVRAQFCGGTLTTPTTVVTAAHCVVSERGSAVADPASILIGF
ncbi:MAG: trypsin-like serine protease, partial [Actinomycetota bacterium]|nr:trypsin-like serine protease [Actinomycetota bacterium]